MEPEEYNRRQEKRAARMIQKREGIKYTQALRRVRENPSEYYNPYILDE